jgi:hypothetical protein
MTETTDEPMDNGWNILPGETKEFLYFGGAIPFEVDVANLDPELEAGYWTQSTGGGDAVGWTLYRKLEGRGEKLTLDWFTSIGRFSNTSATAVIRISGDGIRLHDGSES